MIESILLICASPLVIDGDTIRCKGVDKPIRMAGIDAPDKPAYCKLKKRVCAPGDWRDSKASLSYVISGKEVTYRVVAIDRYRRPVAVMYVGDKDLSCYQIDKRQAIFKPTWNGRHIGCKPKG